MPKELDDAEFAKYYVPTNRRPIVAIALALILFISALDSTIVAVALPTIGADFNEYESTSWVVTAYIITYTAFLPIVSKLTDILGRKPVLIASTLWFMAFSGACGGARSLIQLIVFRALQGIGGSAIYSGVVVTFSTMVPADVVAKYASIIGTVFAASSVAGPLVGGAIVSHVHWGWIFYVNLPIGFVGATLLQLFFTYPGTTRVRLEDIKRRVDWIGAFLLLASAVLLALSLQIGGTSGYPWVSATVLAPLVISILLIPLFVFVEMRNKEPILPLRLFRLASAPDTSVVQGSTIVPQSPNFTLIITWTLCMGAAFYSLTVYLPQRLQIVASLSSISSGVHMLPLLLLVGFLSPFAGACVMLTRSYRPLMWICAGLGAIGTGLLSTVNGIHTKWPELYGFEAIIGVSIGVTITVSTIITQFSVNRADLSAATGFLSFSRTLGGLIGLAVSQAIMNARVSSKLDSLPPDIKPAVEADPTGVLPSLDESTQELVKNAYAGGYQLIFIVAAVWFAVGIIASLGLKHVFPALPPKDGEENAPAAPGDEEGGNNTLLVDINRARRSEYAEGEHDVKMFVNLLSPKPSVTPYLLRQVEPIRNTDPLHPGPDGRRL